MASPVIIDPASRSMMTSNVLRLRREVPLHWRSVEHRVLPGVEDEHDAGVDGEDGQAVKDPAGRVPGGVLVFRVPV